MKKFFFLPLLIVCLYACQKKPEVVLQPTNTDYKKADSLLTLGNDSAFYYFNDIATNSKDSLEVARAYNSMAIIQSDAGDYFGSQQSLLLSLNFLDDKKEKDQYCLLSDYNELGSTSLSLKNYDAAIHYYDSALRFTQEEGYKLIAFNNKAVAYQKEKQYQQAIDIYQSIVKVSKKNKKEYARVLSNLTRVRWLQDSSYEPLADFFTALQIRKDAKDDWGLNASYSHLSDYYYHSHPDSALIYAMRMYGIAQRLNSPDDELEALQKLIPLSPAQPLKEYFFRYQYLNDSLQLSRNNAKNQFALIRYGAVKNRTDNLRLQKENAEKKIQIILQRIILYGALLLFVTLATFAAFWYQKRRQRIAQETQNEIRESKLKTSKKVHDVVANGLYRVMSAVEHDAIGKEELVDKLEILYEQSRDISYEPTNTASQKDFQQVVTSLLHSFETPTTRVQIVGNDTALWNGIYSLIKNELYPVLQELMVNMKKHSGARNVLVKFMRQDNNLHIQYTDDGIGLPAEYTYGNGLANTGNRIKDMHGDFTFDIQRAKGFAIQITIPII